MISKKKWYDTTRISIIGKKRTRLLYLFIILLTVLLLAFVYFLIPDILGDKESISPKIRQMRQLSARVGKLETQVHQKQTEILELMEEYKKQTGEELELFSSLGFSDDAKKILEEKINNQKDVSIKELLNDILNKKKEISKKKKKIEEYEILLPSPHIVKRGENHYQIAMNFLVNEKKVGKEKAAYLVERTLLFESLISGFKVWNFYSGNEYGTFVTQGKATSTPNEIRRLKNKKLTDDRDKAIADKNRLSIEIENLESKKNKLNSQLKNIRKEKEKQSRELEKLQKNHLIIQNKNLEMEKRINSLSYAVELEKNLKKTGILKSKFLGSPKLKEIPLNYFIKTIDLREEKKIEIFAQSLQLSKIEEINLYPKFYKEDIDYKIKIAGNKQKAVIKIMAIDKFRTDRVIISVK